MKEKLQTAAGVLMLLLVVGVLAGFIGIASKRINVNYDVHDDGGWHLTEITGISGFNTVTCFNGTGTPVYFGGTNMREDAGTIFPICNTTACAGRTIGVNTNHGNLYATLAAALDGGVDIYCIWGK